MYWTTSEDGNDNPENRFDDYLVAHRIVASFNHHS